MSSIEQEVPVVAPGCPLAGDFDPCDGMPHAFFEQARRERPVFYHSGLSAYVLTRYEDCRALLSDRSGKVSASAALMQHVNVPIAPEALQALQESGFVPTPGLVDVDGATHAQQRAATQPPFMPNRVGALEDFARGQITQRLDDIVSYGRADLVDELIYEVPATVILHMMGIPDSELGMVKLFRGPWAEFIWGFPTAEVQVDVARSMGNFGKWAKSVMAERLASPGTDILSEAIAKMKDDGKFDEQRAFLDAYTMNIVMAGHETTANTASFGLMHLMQNHDQWQALVDDPTLIPIAVDEILRYSTGVPAWRQRAVSDLTFSGVTIPAGAVIYAALTSANRDEAIFGPDAEQFNIRRANARKYLTFGAGVHTCMGMHLSRLEIRLMLEELTARLPHMTLVPDQTFTFPANTSQRGPEHVVVQWDPTRNPLPGGPGIVASAVCEKARP